MSDDKQPIDGGGPTFTDEEILDWLEENPRCIAFAEVNDGFHPWIVLYGGDYHRFSTFRCAATAAMHAEKWRRAEGGEPL